MGSEWVRKGAMVDDDSGDDNAMDVDMEGHPSSVSVPHFPIHANRTKPLKNAKFQKRLGAKKAKRL